MRQVVALCWWLLRVVCVIDCQERSASIQGNRCRSQDAGSGFCNGLGGDQRMMMKFQSRDARVWCGTRRLRCSRFHQHRVDRDLSRVTHRVDGDLLHFYLLPRKSIPINSNVLWATRTRAAVHVRSLFSHMYSTRYHIFLAQ